MIGAVAGRWRLRLSSRPAILPARPTHLPEGSPVADVFVSHHPKDEASLNAALEAVRLLERAHLTCFFAPRDQERYVSADRGLGINAFPETGLHHEAETCRVMLVFSDRTGNPDIGQTHLMAHAKGVGRVVLPKVTPGTTTDVVKAVIDHLDPAHPSKLAVAVSAAESALRAEASERKIGYDSLAEADKRLADNIRDEAASLRTADAQEANARQTADDGLVKALGKESKDRQTADNTLFDKLREESS